MLRDQSNRDELQRLMASISADIDKLLRREPSHVPKEILVRLKRSGASANLRHMLAASSDALRHSKGNYVVDATNIALVESVKSIIPLDANELSIEFNQLAATMDAYAAAGGSPDVESIYSQRVRVYAAILDALGFPQTEHVKRRFGQEF